MWILIWLMLLHSEFYLILMCELLHLNTDIKLIMYELLQLEFGYLSIFLINCCILIFNIKLIDIDYYIFNYVRKLIQLCANLSQFELQY